MNKLIRRALWGISIAVFLFASVRLYFYTTDDFRLSNISYEMPYQQSWEIPFLPQEQEEQLQKILSQQFSYLGKGAQSYAFASDDGRYVLKFFKFKHLRPSWFQNLLPSIGFIKTYKEKQSARKRRKLYGVFQGYKIAYDHHKNESGLLFIQLNRQDNPNRTVIIRDKIGLKRTVELEHIPFILQEKGQTLRVVLNSLLQQGDVRGAESRIGKIFDLYASEYGKGIYDHDHGVMYNTGFVGDRPIHLDVGKMVQEDSMKQRQVAKQDMQLVAVKMNAWIEKFYPQYHPQLSEYIKQKIEGF